MKKTAFFGWLALSLIANCAELPQLVIPEGVGVNIHFTRGHTEDLDMIAAAGFKWVRMDFAWSGIERTKGIYDWSAYEELTDNIEKRGLRALYIFDYSNPLYEETVVSKNPITGQESKATASPQKPESVAAFARWAAAAAVHFRDRNVIWEIWNEPNIFFWQPKPDVRQYSTLALETTRAIKEANPKSIVVGPATSEVPIRFLEGCFEYGLLDVFDAISVHPYRDYRKPPETAAEDYVKLRELIRRYAKTEAKQRIPILSGEWGYATHSRGVSLDTQAAFAVRQQLANLLAEVALSIWYDWKNDGPDPDEREHNFGVVTADLKAKPAYTAIKTLTTELAGHRIVRRIDVGNANDYVLLMLGPGQSRKLAAWTTGDRHTVSVKARVGDGAEISGVTGLGEKVAAQQISDRSEPESGAGQSPANSNLAFGREKLVLELVALPMYIRLNNAVVLE